MTASTDRTHDELTRLFNLYRLSKLNRRYYGNRSAHFESLQGQFLVASAVLSAIALGLLLAVAGEKIRYVAAVLTGLSAVLTTVTQYFKWDEQARRFYFQHHSYGQLFSQSEALMSDIKRSQEITEQQIGAAKSIHDAFGRVEVLDELNPDRKLIDALDAQVREAFPDDYIWTSL